jgi:hypothetical protein
MLYPLVYLNVTAMTCDHHGLKFTPHGGDNRYRNMVHNVLYVTSPAVINVEITWYSSFSIDAHASIQTDFTAPVC